MTQKSLIAFGFVCSIIGFAGCESKYPKTYPVTGTVTLDGQPLSKAIVTFLPSTGNAANGTTDSNGRFSLSTFVEGDGALPGEYKVSIMPSDPPPMPGDKFSSPGGETASTYVASMPPRYADPNSSGLIFTVTEDANNPKFELVNE